jgi:hypothetical protein
MLRRSTKGIGKRGLDLGGVAAEPRVQADRRGTPRFNQPLPAGGGLT